MEQLYKRADEAQLFRTKGYFSYLIAQMKQNSFYQMWKKFILYFRRIGLVSIILQAAGYIFMLVQSGAVFLLALLILPVILLVAVGVYLTARLCDKHDNRKLKHAVRETNVYIFFPTRTAEFSHGTFWKSNIYSFKETENNCVFVVSPYFFSGKGLFQKHNFYLNYTEEAPRLYLVRKHYFFSLRRILHSCKRVTLIY